MSKATAELLKLSIPELEQRIKELRDELVEQKRAHAGGELLNPHAMRKTRHAIATALTRLKQLSVEKLESKEAK